MKNILTLVVFMLGYPAFAQSDFPDFLTGTWKVEDREVYEHWDQLNSHTLKGFSYLTDNGRMVITEYLDIVRKENRITYTATVINQNQGKGIHFQLTGAGDAYIFENPGHDFPKMIVYNRLSDTEIFVEVSDGNLAGFSYKMIKQGLPVAEQDTTTPGWDMDVSANPDFDPELAEKLGADDYGMKNYILVILKTGKNTTANQELISRSFRGHMDNINRMVETGHLIVAGPVGPNDRQYRGIFILNNVSSMDEVQALLQADPAILEGLLDFEIFTWYGSAALPEYLPFSDKIWKSKP